MHVLWIEGRKYNYNYVITKIEEREEQRFTCFDFVQLTLRLFGTNYLNVAPQPNNLTNCLRTTTTMRAFSTPLEVGESHYLNTLNWRCFCQEIR